MKLSVNQYNDFKYWLSIAMMLFFFITLWVVLILPVSDGDIFFHVLYGKYMLENQTLIPDHTLFAWGPSTNENIYCSWIGQIIYYLIYNFTGLTGVIVFRYLVITVCFLLVVRFAWKREMFFHPLTWLVALLCISDVDNPAHDKPQILSWLFMFVYVYNWFNIRLIGEKAWRYVYFFPFLMLIWVNTHGCFLFGCVFLLFAGIGEGLNQLLYKQNALSKRVFFHLIIASFLTIITLFITPYGFDYIKHLLVENLYPESSPGLQVIMDFRDTFQSAGWGNLLQVNLMIVILCCIFLPALLNKRLDFATVLANLMFVFLYGKYMRATFFWTPLFLFSIIYYQPFLANWFSSRKVVKNTFFIISSVCFLVLSAWIVYWHKCYPMSDRYFGFGISEIGSAEEEILFIKHNLSGAKIGNTYNHGTDILRLMWPENKPMIDTRYFPFKNWFMENRQYEQGVNIEQYLKKYPFDVAEVQHDNAVLSNWYYKNKDWRLVFWGKSSAIYAHNKLGYDKPLQVGNSIDDIKSYYYATPALNFACMIKDWENAERILKTMERNFNCCPNYKTATEGLRFYKNSLIAYDDKNYFAAVDLMDNAMMKEVKNPSRYSGALIMKSIDEWRGGNYEAAIKDAIKSQQIYPNFISSYNLCVMSWQIEKLNQKDLIAASLTDDEKKMTEEWKKMFESMIKNEYKTPARYLYFVDDAREMLEGRADYASPMFMLPDDV